ncbi:MAG: rRNA maturation RNase YbeY [Candidatus Acidoferrales bacterium]
MVVNRQRRVRLDEEDLRRFCLELARALRLPRRSFTVALVSDRRISGLNRRYRRRPYPTDVLSFPAGNGALGEVVISAQTARRHARRYRHSLEEEVKLLTLHGVLHLLGYDHETDRGRMTRREHTLRRRLGLE